MLASALTLQEVGLATFYTSFTAAVLALVQSATTSVTLPTLIAHHDAGEARAFAKEMKRTALIAAGLSCALLLGSTLR